MNFLELELELSLNLGPWARASPNSPTSCLHYPSLDLTKKKIISRKSINTQLLHI